MDAATGLLHRLELLVELHRDNADNDNGQCHDDEGKQDDGWIGCELECGMHHGEGHEYDQEDDHCADDGADDGPCRDEQALGEVREREQEGEVEEHALDDVKGGALDIGIGA